MTHLLSDSKEVDGGCEGKFPHWRQGGRLVAAWRQ